MGALTILPVSILQEAVNENPAPQGPPAAPSTNANQAQNGPAPQDTVILTGKGAETQLNGDGSNGTQPQHSALFFAAQNIFLGHDNTGESGKPQQVQAPLVSAQAQTPGAPQQNPGAPANNAGNPSASSATNTPQQELATLDQTLQDLGINPQSINLVNRMALILYASDPAALRVLVQGLQGAAQQAGQSGTAKPALTAAQLASGQTQGETQASNPSAASGSGSSSAQPVLAQQSTQSHAQVVPQQNGSASSASAPGGSTPQATGPVNQYQDLRFTFAHIAVQDLQSEQGLDPSKLDAKGQGINVTV